MKVIVFGASRGVGRCITEQALKQGYQVTAAVRDPEAVKISHERLHVMYCDVRDAAAVHRVIEGQDVVFCTLGADTRGYTNLYSTAARHIGQAMQKNKVRRLVFLSNFGVLGEKALDFRGNALLFMAKRFLRHTLTDHRRALDEIRQHATDWIAVRPMPLTNGAHTGRYRIAVDRLPARGMRIARADVADFMLQQASSDKFLHQIPAIAY
jgi:putative NADH-flavin reductase